RIYLPPATADEIERLMSLLMYVGSAFPDVNYRDPDTLKQVVSPRVIDAWTQAISASKALFPQLEAEFRKHLGP
ncbi:MAG: hypothetical protein ABIP42_04085, partial [Planctomycetota bacterium]